MERTTEKESTQLVIKNHPCPVGGSPITQIIEGLLAMSADEYEALEDERNKNASSQQLKKYSLTKLALVRPGSDEFKQLKPRQQNQVLASHLEPNWIERTTPPAVRTRSLPEIFDYHRSVDHFHALQQNQLKRFGDYVGPDGVASSGKTAEQRAGGFATFLSVQLAKRFGGTPAELSSAMLALRNEAITELARFLDESMENNALSRREIKQECKSLIDQVGCRALSIGGDL